MSIGFNKNEITPKETAELSYVNFSGVNITTKVEIPQFIESKNREGWINWGKDNLYPAYLISLVNKSPLHSAIIKTKASMLGGNGFQNVELEPLTKAFIMNKGNDEDMEEILQKISLDWAIFNGFVLSIIWSKDRESIAEINYINLDTVRFAVPDKEHPEDINYYICEDWKNWRKNTPVLYQGFSLTNRKEATTILYVTGHRPSNNWYPVPEYVSGISLMELNFMINEYHLNSIQNSFNANIVVSYPYRPKSNQEADDMVNRLKQQYQGIKRDSKIVVLFGESQDKMPTIEKIEANDDDKRFETLTKSMMDGIISAHQLTDRKFLGLEVQEGIGGSSKNEMLESLTIFQAIYISSRQQILEKCINKIARINGCKDKIIIDKYDNNLSPTMPVGDMLSILSSTLTPAQQVQMLISNGYDRQEALLLVNKEHKETTPVNTTAPIKIGIPKEIKNN